MRPSTPELRRAFGLAALSLTLAGGTASAQTELLAYHQPGAATPTVTSPAAVAEYQVTLDVAALSRSDHVAVEIVLPDGSRYLATAEAIERREGESFHWRGRLVGAEDEGTGAITVREGHVAGLLTLPGRLFELAPEAAGEGNARLLELDSSLFPECGGAAEAAGTHPSPWLPPRGPKGDPEIDVLVVYTARARQAAGGTAAIEATIQGAVDVTNEAYTNSEVDQRIVLVHMEEVPYDETGQGTTAQLNWLRTDPSVAALREAHHADMVALIPNELSGACGVGYVMRDVSPTFEAWAYSVTLRTCAVGNRTFAHELGHNMGLEHDPANGTPPGQASYPWSFGHFVSGQFRTVMAYDNQCSGGCPRVGQFSNPHVDFNGFPTGILEQRENARSLNLTGPVVAAFREAPSGPALGFDPPGLDFGDVELGATSPAQAALLRNSGSTGATELELSIAVGAFAADTGDCGAALEPGGSCEISVTFTPEVPGAATAQLQAESLEGAQASLHLEGSGIEPGAPQLDFDPVSHDFGEVEPGGTSPAQVSTLTNTGSAAATELAFSAPGSGFFADTSNCGSALGAGASCEISITFEPDSLGAAIGQLQAESLEGALALLELAGTGIEPGLPALELDPLSLDFGDVEVGGTSTVQSSILTNAGNAEATEVSFSLPGESFDASTSDCGKTLPAGESCSVGIRFTPTEAGPADAMLEVMSAEGASAALGLAGSGVSEGFTAMALVVDSGALGSDGNLVLEPGELVEVAPAWRNDGTVARDLTGAASGFTGPTGAGYVLVLDSADHGPVEPGGTASCLEIGACYQLGVADPAERPAARWAASFDEELSDGTTKTWNLHIGDSFTDVPRSSPFYRAIETLLHHEVTGGCAAGGVAGTAARSVVVGHRPAKPGGPATWVSGGESLVGQPPHPVGHGRPTQPGAAYCPGAVNTRGQMPVFVLRALKGADYVPQACMPGGEAFADVPATSGLCPWIQELYVRGVVAGCGEGVYCPNEPVNRQQMAIFLLRTLEGEDYSPLACTGQFDDVPCSSVFAPWVEALANRGVTGGCSADPPLYCPTDPVNRQQMAAFVSETFELLLYGP